MGTHDDVRLSGKWDADSWQQEITDEAARRASGATMVGVRFVVATARGAPRRAVSGGWTSGTAHWLLGGS